MSRALAMVVEVGRPLAERRGAVCCVRGACEGRIVARGRARDTRSRVDSDMRVRNEGQLVPCAIDFGATNRPERPLLGGMTRWREVRTMHSTSGRYNERGTRRSGSSPKVS